ncbi:sarcosine oxidase subunit gamma [Roseicitreum antarcticum]|uniref:Sarcosine oxidase subunit gamma n=1 Tax=Roseicitreum antarcticum TaxID=564137 RepID=A0A1H2ZT45_9RHOB|nr:sarcosine oxidase subunit gamma family protein [Roseicitreum antarcticum]SDX20740.1 sarcosine oxidase subunit gamma [Roseicitreum antarcticum]
MHDIRSALPGAEYEGYVTLREAGLCGMITLRGDPDTLRDALREAAGLDLPGMRRVSVVGDHALAWMSPDEMLLMLPYADAPATAARLQSALAHRFASVADVSDARAVFHIAGPRGAEVLAKLCPVDTAALTPGDIRRTRAAQVACAVWVPEPGVFVLICFRSVAQYVFDALALSARPGGEVAGFA